MQIVLTTQEAWELGQAFEALPSYVASLTGEDNGIRFAVDLRLIPDAPGPLKLAAKLAPQVRGIVRLESFTAGTAVLAVEASAAGLPAHKFLGMVEGTLNRVIRTRGLPPDSIKILPDARVAVDVQAILPRLTGNKLAGLQVTHFAIQEGAIYLAASL